MGEINLLQPEKKPRFRAPSVRVAGNGALWFCAILIILELGIYGGLFYWRQSVRTQVDGLQREITEIDKQIAASKDNLKLAVRDQGALSNFSDLLQKHLYWSQVLQELGKVALKTATFLSVEASSDTDKFVITGKVASYAELGKVLLGLETSENFSKVELVTSGRKAEADPTASGLGFSIAVNFKHPLIIKPSAGENEKSNP